MKLQHSYSTLSAILPWTNICMADGTNGPVNIYWISVRKAKQSKTTQKHPSCQTDDFLAPYYVPPVNRMGKTPQEKIDVELAGFFRVLSEFFCLEQHQRASTRTRTFPFPSQSVPFSCCLGEKKVLWQINVFPFQIKTSHIRYQNCINYRE